MDEFRTSSEQLIETDDRREVIKQNLLCGGIGCTLQLDYEYIEE